MSGAYHSGSSTASAWSLPAPVAPMHSPAGDGTAEAGEESKSQGRQGKPVAGERESERPVLVLARPMPCAVTARSYWVMGGGGGWLRPSQSARAASGPTLIRSIPDYRLAGLTGLLGRETATPRPHALQRPEPLAAISSHQQSRLTALRVLLHGTDPRVGRRRRTAIGRPPCAIQGGLRILRGGQARQHRGSYRTIRKLAPYPCPSHPPIHLAWPIVA